VAERDFSSAWAFRAEVLLLAAWDLPKLPLWEERHAGCRFRPLCLFPPTREALQALCERRRRLAPERVAALAVGDAEAAVTARDDWAAAVSATAPANAHARIAIVLRKSVRRWLTPPVSDEVCTSLSGIALFGRRRAFSPDRPYGFILSVMVAKYA